MSICIGTSGWHYAHWGGRFYPPGLSALDWLPHYARHFGCVEINNSFYRLPDEKVVTQWLRQTPEDFVFALKASRYITHMKKLRDCAEALAALLSVARLFGHRLAAVLLQLPPRWRVNPGRLDAFLRLLPEGLRFAMEFRDPSWHSEEIFVLLRAYRVAFCQYELAGFSSPAAITADLVYLRLHGPEEAYAGSYALGELTRLAARVRDWGGAGHDVCVFFDNDRDASAVDNARTLRRLVNP